MPLRRPDGCRAVANTARGECRDSRLFTRRGELPQAGSRAVVFSGRPDGAGQPERYLRAGPWRTLSRLSTGIREPVPPRRRGRRLRAGCGPGRRPPPRPRKCSFRSRSGDPPPMPMEQTPVPRRSGSLGAIQPESRRPRPETARKLGHSWNSPGAIPWNRISVQARRIGSPRVPAPPALPLPGPIACRIISASRPRPGRRRKRFPRPWSPLRWVAAARPPARPGAP